MKKKIVFFDGDGTLWYPKETKRTKAPQWLYEDDTKKVDYLKHLTLTPSLLATLKALKKSGLILVSVSTHPHGRKEAETIMKEKVKYFNLGDVLDFYCTARNYPEGKGEAVLRILKKYKIPKTQALMVGDSYRYDYRSARKVGIDALLIETDYNAGYRSRYKPKTIKHIRELPGVLS